MKTAVLTVQCMYSELTAGADCMLLRSGAAGSVISHGGLAKRIC